MRSKALGLALLAALTLVWGTSFPAIKVVVPLLGADSYVYLRFAMATLALTPYAAYRLAKSSNSLKRALVPGVVLGVAYFAGIWLQGFGMEFTTATNAGFITSLYIPIVYAIDVLAFKSRYGASFIVSAVLSVLGLYLISGGVSGVNLGDLLVLGGAFAWALHVVAVDRFASSHHALDLVFIQYLVTTLLGGALVGFSLDVSALGQVLPIILYLALACSVLAGALQVVGQRYTTPSEAALVYTLEPVFAALFSYALLGETLSGARLLGAALILISVTIASWSITSSSRR